MNNLHESRRILEGKIALNKSIMTRKQKEWSDKQKEADELQLQIEAIRIETNQDQMSLEAVNEQISKNPEKTNPVFKDFAKVGVAVIFLLLTSFSFAQPFVSMEAGSRLGINAGYVFNNRVIIKGGELFPYTRRSDISNVTYAGAGYTIMIGDINITPIAGISHYHVSRFDKDLNETIVNKTGLMKSLEVGRNFTTASDHYGNYYLFISHASQLFGGAGLRVFIK